MLKLPPMFTSPRIDSGTTFSLPDATQFIFNSYFDRERTSRNEPTTNKETERHVFFGNEDFSPRLMTSQSPGIKSVGGDLIGCGIGMSLHLASYAKSDRLFIVDTNPEITQVLWPMMLLHFYNSPTRTDFLQSILFDTFSEEQKLRYHSMNPIEICADALALGDSSVIQRNCDIFTKNLHAIIQGHFDEKFPTDQIGDLCYGFALGVRRGFCKEHGIAEKSSEDFLQSSRIVSTYLPSLGAVAQDSFLFDEQEYLWIRNLVLSDRLIVATGDMFGDTLNTFGVHFSMKQARIVYVDNLPRIVSWNDFSGQYVSGMDQISRVAGPETTIICSSLTGENGPLHAYPLTSSEFNVLAISKMLEGSHYSITDDYAGIIHSRLLNNVARLREETTLETAIQDILEGDYTARELSALCPKLKDLVRQKELKFNTSVDFWEYAQNNLSKTGDRERDKCGLDPANSFIVERMLFCAGVIRKL